jgi:flagellar motor switch protein FliM
MESLTLRDELRVVVNERDVGDVSVGTRELVGLSKGDIVAVVSAVTSGVTLSVEERLVRPVWVKRGLGVIS